MFRNNWVPKILSRVFGLQRIHTRLQQPNNLYRDIKTEGKLNVPDKSGLIIAYSKSTPLCLLQIHRRLLFHLIVILLSLVLDRTIKYLQVSLHLLFRRVFGFWLFNQCFRATDLTHRACIKSYHQSHKQWAGTKNKQ